MKKLFVYVGILLFLPLPLIAQGEFFGEIPETEANPSITEEKIEDSSISKNLEDLNNTEVGTENLQQTPETIEHPINLLDKVKIRVNNLILTERQLSILFGLRKLSSFLSKYSTLEEVEQEMTLILGLEAFAKTNNLYNLLPTRNEMDKRIDFLNSSTQSQTLAQSLAKIDPAGNLHEADIRQFFYYQILREKGFVYALQQDFLNKIFSPRDDEILLLYKQVLLSDPKIFQSSAQLYVMNIAIVEPPNEQKKEQIIKMLEGVKKSIDQEPDLEKKEKKFLSAIQKYSSPHLRNSNIIGPLDENLINEDFPEYKDLFKLKTGGVSNIINQDGFIRLVFAKQKSEGEIKSVTTPEIRQKIISIIYDGKGNILFHQFLEDNLKKFDVHISKMEPTNE